MPAQESMGVGAREKIDIKRLRADMGLPKYSAKKRLCLKCDREFVSYGFDNRLCANCGQSNENSSGLL